MTLKKEWVLQYTSVMVLLNTSVLTVNSYTLLINTYHYDRNNYGYCNGNKVFKKITQTVWKSAIKHHKLMST